MDMILADSALKGLKPDPAWDVAGVRDMVGGVIAVALVLCVGVIILGCITLIPGLVTNNQMERAFSWKRLLAAMLVPFVIGAAVSGWSWSCNLFGSQGLQSNRSYTQAGGNGSTNLADHRGKGNDSLTDLVKQLGDDIVKGIGDTVKSAVKGAVKGAVAAGNFVTGGDGKGNLFQKIGEGAKDVGDFVTGGDGKGNLIQKTGEGLNQVGGWLTGGDGKGNVFQKAGNGIKDAASNLVEWATGK